MGQLWFVVDMRRSRRRCFSAGRPSGRDIGGGSLVDTFPAICQIGGRALGIIRVAGQRLASQSREAGVLVRVSARSGGYAPTIQLSLAGKTSVCRPTSSGICPRRCASSFLCRIMLAPDPIRMDATCWQLRVNHVKMARRQVSGRAGLPLLRKRVLLTARN
jgi:hypothetical protein